MLEKTLKSHLDSKGTKPVNPKGNQSWLFIGRTDAEAETPILWPPDVKNWLIWKDPDAGKDWRQEEKEMTEDEMVGWPHQLSRHKFEHTLGDDEGRGSLASAVHGATRVRHYWVTEQQQPSALALLAAAAKSSQSCPTLCDPIDSSPPGSPVPGILQARMLEWVAISFSNA